MLRVQNKKVVGEIARITYRANKKRNLLTIFAVILTTFLITVVIAIGISYWDSISERQVRMQGMDYDIELSEPREDQADKIKSMDSVKYAGIAIKCAIVEEYQGRLLDKTRLYWLDKTCWEKQTVPALESYEGHYPQDENEVMLGTSALKAMGIPKPKLGMKLVVTYSTLKEKSGEESLMKEFVLCGWYKDYSGSKSGYISKEFLDTTGVKQTEFTQGSLKITLQNPLYSEEDIMKIQKEIDLGGKQYIAADYETIANFYKTAAGLAVLLFMIFTSGYLFIYNTLYISISKDIRYYGQLKTVGMTSVQLKQMVYRQAFWNALAGIPAGLAAAAGVTRFVVPQMLQIVNPIFSAKEIVSVKPWVFGLAACFAMLTNWVSCRKPAKIVGDCSAIEAIRYIGGAGKRRSRKRESSGIYAMAVQNLFRDPKQALVIFASFTIALLVFFVVNVVILENDGKHILGNTGTMTYDMQFRNETMLEEGETQVITEDKIAQIEKIEGVKCVRKVTSAKAVIPYQEEVYGKYYKDLYQSRYSPGNYEEDMALYRKDPDNDFFAPRLVSVDKRGFEVMCKNLGKELDWEDFESGKIAAAIKYFTEGDSGMTGKTAHFRLPGGKEPDREHTIRIAAVGDIYSNPAFFAGGSAPDLVVSESYAKKLMGELLTELINIEYEEPFSKETEQKVRAVFKGEKRVSCDSKLDRYNDMRNSEMQVKVLGGSLGFLIAMLAMLNYLNMMAASIQNRSREFAVLESVGMTAKQTKKMLRAEGIGYAGISAVFSLVIGLPASYTVFQGMNIYRIPFAVPWGRNLLLFLAVLCLCMVAPVLIYQRTQNKSIIERLRNGEEA